MGNEIYRPSPRKIFNSCSGNTSRFKFAANQITGWRHSQEDRYVCFPNFEEDVSLFAVFDGHGGEEVAQYLERFLHLFISRELELTKDIELALYLSFLNCDSSLRFLSKAEYELIKNDLVKEFEVPDKAERRRVLFGSFDVAGSSEKSETKDDDLRSAIAHACLKELPSISYLTQAPVEDSDENDDEYHPGDEIMDVTDDSEESLNSSDSYEEATSDNELDKVSADNEPKNEKIASTDSDAVSSNIQVSADCKDKEVNDKMKEEEYNDEKKYFGKKIGEYCGSTATVVLIKEGKIYIAHVGDSRCVACIKGQATDLTKDHRPNDSIESERILNAGGHISKDDRIESDIDMSRAFGDFRYKKADDPFQILTAEAHISSIEINEDLEFVILASDGIWNTMDSPDVINYIQRRMQDKSLELQDLIGELFLELLPEEITPDGSGCDNMTAILITFANIQEISSRSDVSYRDIYEFKYLPIKKNNSSNKKSTNENSSQSSKQEEKIYFSGSSDECTEYSEAKKFCNYKHFKGSSNSSEKNKNTRVDNVEIASAYKHQQLNRSNANSDLAPIMAAQTVQQKINPSENSKDSMQLQQVGRISTNKHQQSCRSNENCDSAPTMSGQAVQQKINPSENCEKNKPSENCEKNKPSEKCEKNKPSENSEENNSILHARVMTSCLASIGNIQRVMESTYCELSRVKAVVELEMKRFNSNAGPLALIDISSDEEIPEVTSFVPQGVEKEEAVSPSIDNAAVQSPTMQVEQDPIDHKNAEVKTPEQSVEENKVEKTVMEVPTVKIAMQTEPEPVDHISEVVKPPEQSVEQYNVKKTEMETPMEKIETDQDGCKNKQTTAQSVQNEEKLFRMKNENCNEK